MTGDETGRTFKYDAWNRLVEVKNSGGTTLATYRYNSLGQRIRETRSGTTTDLYYSSAWQVLEERVGSAVQRSYVWSLVYVDSMICRDRDTDANGTLDERLYAVQDANFNVVALIDTSGAVTERYTYDAFGAFTVLTGTWGSRSSSSYAWVHQHQGLKWDSDLAAYDSRRRILSPTTGRFFQLDPIGINAGDMNLYRAVANDPLGLLDPTGEQSTKEPTTVPKPQPYKGNIADLFGEKNSAVCVTKASPEEDNNPLLKNRFGKCNNIDRGLTTWEDLIKKLDNYYKPGKGTGFKAIAIVGHGTGANGGGVAGTKDEKTGNTLTYLTNSSLTDDDIAQLDQLLPKDCVIVIAACGQGKYTKGMQELARRLKRTVIAPNCDCGGPGAGGFDLKGKGPDDTDPAWLVFEPPSKK
jgi:RHS repeat-associated protein